MLRINAFVVVLWFFFLFKEKEKSNQLSYVKSTFSGPCPCNSSSLSQNTRVLTFALEVGSGEWGCGPITK